MNSGTGMGLQHNKQKVFYKTSLARIIETLQVLQKTYIKVKGESPLYSSCINLSKALLLHLNGLGHEVNMYLKASAIKSLLSVQCTRSDGFIFLGWVVDEKKEY